MAHPGESGNGHDVNNEAFKTRWAKVRQYGLDLMKLKLKNEGLADKFKVSDKDITKGAIERLTRGKQP